MANDSKQSKPDMEMVGPPSANFITLAHCQAHGRVLMMLNQGTADSHQVIASAELTPEAAIALAEGIQHQAACASKQVH